MIFYISDIEPLRLMRAFYQIDDPQVRRNIIVMTEAAASRNERDDLRKTVPRGGPPS